MLDGSSMKDRVPVKSVIMHDYVDIMAGHYPLRAATLIPDWSVYRPDVVDVDNESTNVQYMSFFRDAVSKYVSAKMYKKRGTKEEHVARIKTDIANNVRKGRYYDNYSHYLITPDQREYMEEHGVKLTIEQRTNLICNNLIKHNVLVGIVEKMPESMELFQFVLDSNDEVVDLFERYGMKPKDGKEVSPATYVASNVNPVSTTSIVEELKKDEQIYELLKEYTKYEKQISDFALLIHERQYESMIQAKQQPSQEERG